MTRRVRWGGAVTSMARTVLTLPALLVLSITSLASARDAPRRAAPALRIDVDLPSIGVGGGSLRGDPALTASAGARIAARTGDGGYLGVTLYDGSPGTTFLGPSPAQASAFVFDAGYLRRFRLVGDDRLGLVPDVQGGFSIGSLELRQARNGLCFSSGTPLPQVPESVADGLRAGANVGASFDVRLRGFTIGIDARHRIVNALEQGMPGDRRGQHVPSAGVHLGLGID